MEHFSYNLAVYFCMFVANLYCIISLMNLNMYIIIPKELFNQNQMLHSFCLLFPQNQFKLGLHWDFLKFRPNGLVTQKVASFVLILLIMKYHPVL